MKIVRVKYLGRRFVISADRLERLALIVALKLTGKEKGKP